jgi:hypothetical protein
VLVKFDVVCLGGGQRRLIRGTRSQAVVNAAREARCDRHLPGPRYDRRWQHRARGFVERLT